MHAYNIGKIIMHASQINFYENSNLKKFIW